MGRTFCFEKKTRSYSKSSRLFEAGSIGHVQHLGIFVDSFHKAAQAVPAPIQ